MAQPLSLSVVICTLGREASVSDCLRSLAQQHLKPHEVIIVDAAPGAHQTHWQSIAQGVFPLQVLATTPGLTHQRNVGIVQATGDIIAFFDDDTTLEPECLAAMAEIFAADQEKKIGAVCGHIIGQQPIFRSPLSRLHALIGQLMSRMFFLSRPGNGQFLPSGMPTFLLAANTPTRIECLYGAAMAFRAEVIKQEKCDERLTTYSYMEDDDIAYRVSRHHQIMFAAGARLLHHQSPANRLRQRALGKMLIINHHYLFRKNFPRQLRFRLAHLLSLFGYPLLQLWNLNPRRAAGALQGLGSITWRRDPLSRIAF